ncbi:MAG: proteasome accessory factor PafA2 family protein [Candidatus Tectomicrobia bacterium]|nr:proteasome accessory factor PafA2 family protein [Candidatus Tectomicrobia bacterium]
MGSEMEYGVVHYPDRGNQISVAKIFELFLAALEKKNYIIRDLFLENGARFYRDTGGHSEYATPECSCVRELIRCEKAGERILEELIPLVVEDMERRQYFGKLFIFKNNNDFFGNTYGCHENYLMDARLYVDLFGNNLEKLYKVFIPFLVTRQIYCGAGKVVITNGGREFSYQISQRADHIDYDISSNTTSDRGIINTRDRSLSDNERYRRLHIIIGDSNMSEFSIYLRMGITGIILQMISDRLFPLSIDMSLEQPARALKEISYDISCKKELALSNGKRMTAIEIQREYLDLAKKYFSRQGTEIDPESADIMEKWERVLDKLEEDPMQLDREVDWVIKKRLIDLFLEKKGVEVKKVRGIDLNYHDIRRDQGGFYKIQKLGWVEKIVSEGEVEEAKKNPPQSTRAKIRGEIIKVGAQSGLEVSVSNWGRVHVNSRRINLSDPFSHSYQNVDEILRGVGIGG